jgi:hypothetical protein
MTTFKYTESEDVASSAVDTLTYNANTQELVVDLHDDLYLYPGVSPTRFQQLLNAPSVGRDFQALKRSHGPSSYLGRYGSVSFVKDTPRTSGPFTPTKPLPGGVVGTDPVSPSRFSLAAPAVAATPAVSAPTYTVDFEVNGEAKEYTPKNVRSVDEALEALEDALGAVGVNGTVKGVYVSFE